MWVRGSMRPVSHRPSRYQDRNQRGATRRPNSSFSGLRSRPEGGAAKLKAKSISIFDSVMAPITSAYLNSTDVCRRLLVESSGRASRAFAEVPFLICARTKSPGLASMYFYQVERNVLLHRA